MLVDNWRSKETPFHEKSGFLFFPRTPFLLETWFLWLKERHHISYMSGLLAFFLIIKNFSCQFSHYRPARYPLFKLNFYFFIYQQTNQWKNQFYSSTYNLIISRKHEYKKLIQQKIKRYTNKLNLWKKVSIISYINAYYIRKLYTPSQERSSKSLELNSDNSYSTSYSNCCQTSLWTTSRKMTQNHKRLFVVRFCSTFFFTLKFNSLSIKHQILQNCCYSI